MTIRSKLTPFIAAISLSSVAAHAQSIVDLDPNFAPSTAAEEARLPKTSANSPQLSAAPDPDLAPSIPDEEMRLPATPADSPQLAMDPDPDLAESTTTGVN